MIIYSFRILTLNVILMTIVSLNVNETDISGDM